MGTRLQKMLCSLCAFASKAMAVADIGRERGGPFSSLGKTERSLTGEKDLGKKKSW